MNKVEKKGGGLRDMGGTDEPDVWGLPRQD